MRQLLFIAFVFAHCSLIAQSVDRNDIIISTSPGVSMNYYGPTDTSMRPFQTGSSYWGIRAPLSAEYAFSRKFGISADFVYTRLNAGTMHPSDFTVLDFGLSLRFHSPSSTRLISWFGAIGFHYSKLHYSFHGDFTHEITNANGYSLYYEAGANVPLSANRKFGMGLSTNGSGYVYNKAAYSNDTGGQYSYELKGLALALGLNFYYKI